MTFAPQSNECVGLWNGSGFSQWASTAFGIAGALQRWGTRPGERISQAALFFPRFDYWLDNILLPDDVSSGREKAPIRRLGLSADYLEGNPNITASGLFVKKSLALEKEAKQNEGKRA